MNLDSLIVFDPLLNKRKSIALPFKEKLPISLIYYHNIDSVFIFMDRLYIKKINEQFGKKKEDFYLINKFGQIINSYSLDSVPNINNKIDSNRIMLNKRTVTNKMISQNKIYLPFYVFKPNSTSYNQNINLLCEYELYSKKHRMLNIYVEKEEFLEKTDRKLLMILDYQILNDSELVFSFKYKPIIYRYNINTNETEALNSLNDFLYFKRKDTNSVIEFNSIEYAEKDETYYRNVTIENLRNKNITYIKEFFDSSFSPIGYLIQNPENASIYCYDGFLAFNETGENKKKFIYHAKLKKDKSISLSQWNILINQKMESNIIKNKTSSEKETLTGRLYHYGLSLGLKANEKIMCINYDQSCSSTMNFVFKTINMHSNELINNRIKFVIYSENIDGLKLFEEQYKTINRFFIFDFTKQFRNYMNDSDLDKQFVFIMNENSLSYLNTYTCNEVETVFSKLINYKSTQKRIKK